jgi:hypothetical protein
MNIVFAHFKTKFPKHLLLNIQRTIILFPSHQVFLITDQEVDKLKIGGLLTFHFTEAPEWLEVEKLLDHPKDFRGNFWFTSLARFIAISYFAKMHEGPLIHIESDVIVSSDFPFEAFSLLTTSFAFPIVSDNQAIASCLFIQNKEAAADLAQLTLESVRRNTSTTDMYILHDLFVKEPERVQILASAPSHEYALDDTKKYFLKKNSESIEYFKGIFDGFDIGRYLFGDDPRNDRGFSVLRRKDSLTYLDASRLDFLLLDNHEFPYVRNRSNQSIMPVYALHIHSKNLKLFGMVDARSMIRKAVLDSKNESQKIFSLTIFLKSVLISIRRRYRLIRHSR